MAKGKYQEWLKEENIILMQGWARNGLTDEQIAHNMGITAKTLYEWKNKYSVICEALKESKEVADLQVENALYKSAIGHRVTLRKPVKVKTEKSVPGKGKIVEETITYVDEETYIPPNVTAQIYWLKNRRRDKWQDKPAIEELEVKIDNGLIDALRGISEADLIDDDDFLPGESEGDN